MNKSGFVSDVGLVIAALLVIALFVVIGAKLFNDINEGFQDSNVLGSTAKNHSATLEARYVGLFDGIFTMVFGLLAIALIISVILLGSRPEFFFVTVIIGFFIVGGAALLGNVWDSFATDTLATTAIQFTFIPLIMSHLVEISLFLLAALLIGLFVKARGVV